MKTDLVSLTPAMRGLLLLLQHSDLEKRHEEVKMHCTMMHIMYQLVLV